MSIAAVPGRSILSHNINRKMRDWWGAEAEGKVTERIKSLLR